MTMNNFQIAAARSVINMINDDNSVNFVKHGPWTIQKIDGNITIFDNPWGHTDLVGTVKDNTVIIKNIATNNRRTRKLIIAMIIMGLDVVIAKDH